MYPSNANFIRFERPVYIEEDEEEGEETDMEQQARPTSQVDKISSEGSSESKGLSQSALRDLLLEQTLDATVPPRINEDSYGRKFVLALSREQCSRDEIRGLNEQLDQWLCLREAKKFGICPIRRELCSELFDEVIRQCTILSPDRGQLLLRCREEGRMTTVLLQTLADDSISWAKRVALETENVGEDIREDVARLERELEPRREGILKLEYDLDQVIKRNSSEKNLMTKKHAEKMEFLKKLNQQMSDLMEMIMREK